MDRKRHHGDGIGGTLLKMGIGALIAGGLYLAGKAITEENKEKSDS